MFGELRLYEPGNHGSVNLLGHLLVRSEVIRQCYDLVNDLLHALRSPNIRRGGLERGSLFDVRAALSQKGHYLLIDTVDIGSDLFDRAAWLYRADACTHENSRKWLPGLTPELSRLVQ